ncbi:MAG: hypothetical protein U0R76_02885 [Candidatus Nanopelagicales bacterium]
MTRGCDTCGKPAKHTTPSGRRLCDAHYRELAGVAGAATAMVDGQPLPTAVGTGIAAQAYAGTMDAEAAREHALQQRIADEPSFWRRMKLRIIG